MNQSYNNQVSHQFVTYFPKSIHSDKQGFNALPKSSHIAAHTSKIIPVAACGGHIFAFNFGSISFWNIPADQHKQLLMEKLGLSIEDLGFKIWDDYKVSISENVKPTVNFNEIILDKMTLDRAEVIALILGQSVAMEFYEQSTEKIWRIIDKSLRRLQSTGRVSFFPSHLPKTIGTALVTRGEVVRVLHMLDRPDLVWEDKIMDSLYDDLRSCFDLTERFQAIEYKLGLIQNTSELLLGIARDRRFYWLELSIVLLILFEICMTLYEKLF